MLAEAPEASALLSLFIAPNEYEKIILDSSILLLLSLVLIVSAAILEVWVTPLFF